MSQLDSQKDYYKILGANERTSPSDLERLYKRMAARSHPDRGGSEEEMKSLNEAYSVLKNKESRHEYDEQRVKAPARFAPAASPTAPDVGLLGPGLRTFFFLLIGLFLLFLVRLQWIRFLWPLALLAVFIILLGIVMARSAMRAFNASLPVSNRFRRYTRAQEVIFWSVVISFGYGLYLLLTAI